MARKSSRIKLESLGTLTYTTELSDWIEAISTFQIYYTHLSSFCKERSLYIGSQSGSGQCPIDQLTTLVCTMETELANLMLDFNPIDPGKQAYTREGCSRLVAHTQILNQLNERAQTMMVLTTLTTS